MVVLINLKFFFLEESSPKKKKKKKNNESASQILVDEPIGKFPLCDKFIWLDSYFTIICIFSSWIWEKEKEK